MRTRNRLGALGAACLLTGLVACGDIEDSSLCTVWVRYEEAVASLEGLSLDGSTAGEAAERVEDVLGQVRHLDSVADTRYSQQLDELEESLDNLLRVLESVEEDADSATWEPLVEDSVEEARIDGAAVSELIEPACTPIAT